ncbi:MAG: metallophosphoesterase [Bryobacteraceae bacterium]
MNISNWEHKDRLKAAWDKLPDDRKAAIQPLIDAAHEQLRTYQATGKVPPPDPAAPHHLILAKGALTDDADGTIAALPELEPGAIEIAVDAGGAIWGTGDYQQLDPGWLGAAAAWFEHLILGKYPFPNGTPPVGIVSDKFTMAIAGDFGTGDWGTAANPAPSTKIRRAIPGLAPDLTIHLGDVYYEGSSDEEIGNFVDVWPQGPATAASYTLNSNHEMYSGAKPYFVEALNSPLFAAQRPYSFFALENANWVIVGLDSAYYSDELTLYMNGSLGKSAQVDFLKAQAQKGKKVILFTHHNGLSEDGSTPTGLWNEVMSCFPAGSGPAYWYWGHVHAGAVYQPRNGVQCRCSGHSALPWGYASELANPNVAWFEKRNAGDPNDTLRVYNGFTFLQLTGTGLTETFYDENGRVAWPANQTAPAAAAG